MKHQLDATLCRFYFCRVTTCFGRKRPSSGVFKTNTAATGTCVIVAGKSSHLLIRAGTETDSVLALIRRCDVLVLNTPDDGRLRPKHVQWLCRNKTCTVLHQVGVSFDLYYDARKHKIKIKIYRNFTFHFRGNIFRFYYNLSGTMKVIKRKLSSADGVLGYYSVYGNKVFVSSFQWKFENSQQIYCHLLGNNRSVTVWETLSLKA